MNKMFAVAGISTLEGDAKVRFAKDLSRVKVLEKNGHKDIKLVELPNAMTKADAVAYLLTHTQFKDAAVQSVLKAYGDDKPAKTGTVDIDATKLVKPSVSDDVEDAKSKNLKTLKEVHAKMKAENKITG